MNNKGKIKIGRKIISYEFIHQSKKEKEKILKQELSKDKDKLDSIEKQLLGIMKKAGIPDSEEISSFIVNGD